MIMNSRSGKDFRAKQEGDHQDADNYNKISKIIPSSSRQQWSSTLKNPRIVRVSHNFGGKDRHSKVCTIRGLRDRRIRLSVPTAIQLYDLQDRLGLSQPSKVVDWLLEVTKHEIDKLPPLPMPFGMNFAQFAPQESSANQTHNYQAILSRKEELGIKNQENHQEGLGFGGYVAQNFFPMGTNYQSSFPMNYNWDHHSSNLSLSQFGSHLFANQIEETSSAPPSSSSSQLYFYPSATTMPPFNFPPLIPSVMSMTPSMENDLRQINHLQQVHQQNPVFPTTLHLISSNANQKNVRPMEQRNEERSDS